jgi:cobalt-zinc-cadmium resistance protein CzcA
VIDRFVSACLDRRWLMVALFLLIAAFGVYSWTELSVEAYPDISDTTAQVVTTFPGHAAEEVEEQVTIPLERELNGIPGLQVMRSKSTFGLSLITLVFRDGVEDYFARQRIQERINGVNLPTGAMTGLDPLTSPIGEIYRYTLESPGRNERELRELQEWVVIPTLKQVFGVADVTNFGGEMTQFQLLLDPSKLAQYNLGLKQVMDAVSSNNSNAGGSVVRRGDEAFIVRGIGLIRSLDDLGNIVVNQKNGTPVLLRNLGELRLGALERNGILGKDNNPDGVSGIVLLLRGENPSRVLKGLHAKVTALNRGLLPPDVKVVPYLDRTDLVKTTLHTVSRTLLEGMTLVLLVLMLFLGSIRGALIVAITIPLSLLIAFILMHLTNIPANLLSLGAIDFGIIVDGSIVVMENILRRREADVFRHHHHHHRLHPALRLPAGGEEALLADGLHGGLRAWRSHPRRAGAGARAGARRLQPSEEVLEKPGPGVGDGVLRQEPARCAGAAGSGAGAGGRGALGGHHPHHHRGQRVLAGTGRGLHLAPGAVAARHLPAAGERHGHRASAGHARIQGGVLRRHPAWTKRRRDGPLDAVSH